MYTKEVPEVLGSISTGGISFLLKLLFSHLHKQYKNDNIANFVYCAKIRMKGQHGCFYCKMNFATRGIWDSKATSVSIPKKNEVFKINNYYVSRMAQFFVGERQQ